MSVGPFFQLLGLLLAVAGGTGVWVYGHHVMRRHNGTLIRAAVGTTMAVGLAVYVALALIVVLL